MFSKPWGFPARNREASEASNAADEIYESSSITWTKDIRGSLVNVGKTYFSPLVAPYEMPRIAHSLFYLGARWQFSIENKMQLIRIMHRV